MIAYRWMSVSDTHGDQIDRGAWDAAMEFARHFKPDRRFMHGDHFDFRWLRKGASDEEKREGVLEDVECGISHISEWAPRKRLEGNHDDRLRRALEETHSGGPQRELARIIAEKIAKETPSHDVVPYHKRHGFIDVGDHKLLHGYGSGIYMTRKHALAYGNCIIGHGHAVEIASSGRHDGATGYQSGCLCTLDMDYNRAHLGTLRQRHGFAYGVVTKAGRCIVWVAREDDGTWILPSELTTHCSTPSGGSESLSETGDPSGHAPAPSCGAPPASVTTAWASSYEMPSSAASWRW